MSQSQRRIQDCFCTGDSTTPVTDSLKHGLTNTLEDLHLPNEGQAGSPGRNEAESQPGSETQSETDECTDLHDTATSTIAISTSLCRTSCECQCCSNVSVLSPKDILCQLGQQPQKCKQNPCSQLCVYMRFQSKYSLKLNLTLPNFQNFPGRHAPSCRPLEKACFACQYNILLLYYTLLPEQNSQLFLCSPTIYHLPTLLVYLYRNIVTFMVTC